MQHCSLEKMFYFIIIILVDKMTEPLIINNAKNLYNYLILQKSVGIIQNQQHNIFQMVYLNLNKNLKKIRKR